MVKLLHREGIEVILDVVYNHTAEQDRTGATLSWRGLDQRAYYRLDERGRDIDVTGCGNTLDLRHPVVCRMVLDSLRTGWRSSTSTASASTSRVALGRGRGDEFDPDHPFLVALRTDPVLSQVKLIAEPWDVGMHGWRTGQFPPPFMEWNDRYRDTVRRFWIGDVRAADARAPRPRRAGPRDPAGRLPRPLRPPRPRPDGLGELRLRPRRLHDGRPHGLRPQAQRGQRRGQPRRQQRQLARGTTASRARATTRPSGGPAARPCATSSARCCCPPASR